MRSYRLRTDLKRAVIDGYALPLGLTPGSITQAPQQGYTVEYVPGEEDEPDTYSFHIVVSHERLVPILHRMLDLLPDEVYGIVEIGSRDAYRSMDVYMAQEPIPRRQFMRGWRRYEASTTLRPAFSALGRFSYFNPPRAGCFLHQLDNLCLVHFLMSRPRT